MKLNQLAILAARALPDYKADAKERMREGQRKGARTKAQAAEEVPQAEAKPTVHVPYAPDRAQTRAAKDYAAASPELRAKVDSGGPLLRRRLSSESAR